MSVTVLVNPGSNGLTLCHKGSNGMAEATLPDVCKTPTPGGPSPMPYPNVAFSSDLAKGTTTVHADGGNMCANYGSEFSKSTGDEPGTLGGIESGTFIKEATWMTFSFDVKLEGKGACRLTDKLFMNHMNTVCLAGWIQENLRKIEQMKADPCKSLFEFIMELVDGGGKWFKGRGLEGDSGRFVQNTKGGGLGSQGAPNAPRNHPPSKDFPQGANDWETHDKEIEKQQKQLNERLDEMDDDCNGGSRAQRKELERAREVANRPRPTKADWQGPKWVPPAEPATSLSTSSSSSSSGWLVVGGLLLVVIAIAAAPETGGTSLGLLAL